MPTLFLLLCQVQFAFCFHCIGCFLVRQDVSEEKMRGKAHDPSGDGSFRQLFFFDSDLTCFCLTDIMAL